MAVDVDDAYANLALPAKIKEFGLSSNDAGLATELTYGTLRMQGFYDRVIANAAARDIDTIDLVVLNILRMGVHQLLNMRVAQHAAVDESVNLAEHMASLGAVGFVNAVLRRTSRHDLEDWQEFITKDISNADERLAALYSHPVWIVRALKQSLEAEDRGEELENLLASDNVNPRVTLVELPGFVDANDEVEGEPTKFSPLGMSLNTGGDPTRFARVREGVVRVQDEGSQLAALVLSRHHEITPGEKWLDMCAGPGGKAALLAAEATLGGAGLTANEVIPGRADLVLRRPEPPQHRRPQGLRRCRAAPRAVRFCLGLGGHLLQERPARLGEFLPRHRRAPVQAHQPEAARARRRPPVRSGRTPPVRALAPPADPWPEHTRGARLHGAFAK